MPDRRRSSLHSASHSLEQHIRGHKVAQSAGRAWEDVEAQIFRRARHEDEVLVPAVAEPLLVWVISGDARIEERDLDGEWHGGAIEAGSFYLTQADAPYLMRWQAAAEDPFEVMHLYLGSDLVNRAALSLDLRPSRLRMREVSGGRDALVSGILGGLVNELRASHPASSLYVKGLLDSLTVHLLRHYRAPSAATERRTAQLPNWKLQRAVDHMEAHLAAPFDLDRLSGLCLMSRFHFSRAFRNTMGQSPSRWFVLRRVERAKALLRDTDDPVINVAMTVGYESPSHFAMVFRRETGLSPRQYRTLRAVSAAERPTEGSFRS